MRIKAILFDLDGVIVDSEPLHFEAHEKALAHFGVELTHEDYMNFGVAQGDDNLYEKASRKYGIEINKEDISKIKKQIYKEIFSEKGKIIPGIFDTLEKFSKKYDLAIVSSGAGDIEKYVISKFDIGKYFKVVVTGDDVEKVKPSPDVYFKAIKLLGCDKKGCVAIEDSVTGIAAAKDAGIKCIAIPNEFTKNQDLSRADVILSSIKEVDEKLINNL